MNIDRTSEVFQKFCDKVGIASSAMEYAISGKVFGILNDLLDGKFAGGEKSEAIQSLPQPDPKKVKNEFGRNPEEEEAYRLELYNKLLSLGERPHPNTRASKLERRLAQVERLAAASANSEDSENIEA